MPEPVEDACAKERRSQQQLRVGLGLSLVVLSNLAIWFAGTEKWSLVLVVSIMLGLMGLSTLFSAWNHTPISRALAVVFGFPIALFQITAPLILGILGAIISIISIFLSYGYSWSFGVELPGTANVFATLTMTSVVMTPISRERLRSCV
jgi:hypothetical protein